MLKKFWRPETGIFLGIWLVLMVGGRSRFFHDPGTFWHTVLGEQILSSGQVIHTDSFSFTCEGKTYIDYEWLGEWAMGLLHRIDQFDSLLLGTVTLLAGLYTWAAHRLMAGGLHWSLALLLTGLAIAASAADFHVRPHIATIVFLGCTCAFLGDFETGWIGLGRLFWLVPLFVVWTNVHGGMLGGLFTLGLAVAGWCLYWILGKKSPIMGVSQALLLVFLVTACGLTAFVNPYGWELPLTWRAIMEMPHLPEIIQEHAPLDPAKPDGWIVLVFGGVYGVALLGVLPRWPRVTWLIPLVWFYLACTRIRHAPLFSITAVMALGDLLPHTCWAVWLARPGSDLFQFPKEDPAKERAAIDWRAALLPFAVVLVTAVLQAGKVPVPVLGDGWAQLDAGYWPVELLPELKRHEPGQPREKPIFNDLLYGGFLIYFTPGYQVFADDRCELYGDQWLWEYVAAERGQNTAGRIHLWEEQYPEFDLALTRTGSEFDRYFSGNRQEWAPLKQTQTATLYRRRAGGDRFGPALAMPGKGPYTQRGKD